MDVIGVAGGVYAYFLSFIDPRGMFDILVSVQLVLAALVGADAHALPQAAQEAVRAAGTDHAIYRLGDDMVVRLPRLPTAAGRPLPPRRPSVA
jgi:hypothetical protein